MFRYNAIPFGNVIKNVGLNLGNFREPHKSRVRESGLGLNTGAKEPQ